MLDMGAELGAARLETTRSGDAQIVYTHRGYDWTSRFRSIAAAVAKLPATNVVLDGEVIVPDNCGASDYHALQLDLAQGRTDRFVYFVFDLLYLGRIRLAIVTADRAQGNADRLVAKASSQIRLS